MTFVIFGDPMKLVALARTSPQFTVATLAGPIHSPVAGVLFDWQRQRQTRESILEKENRRISILTAEHSVFDRATRLAAEKARTTRKALWGEKTTARLEESRARTSGGRSHPDDRPEENRAARARIGKGLAPRIDQSAVRRKRRCRQQIDVADRRVGNWKGRTRGSSQRFRRAGTSTRSRGSGA